MWSKIIEHIQNLFIPEDSKIQKLMNFDPNLMKELLPKSPVYSKDLFVLFDYQNQNVRLIVKSIKYRNHINLRRRLALYLYEELVDLISEITLFEGSSPILIPMPMSKIEKRKRGFNQCEELVREIKKLSGGNIMVAYDTLKKIRETERQTKLSREARAENLKNSMTVSDLARSPTSGQVVIVLDDVYTTGATLTEAKHALLSAGAKRVIGLFIAH